MSAAGPDASALGREVHLWFASTGDPAVARRLDSYPALLTADEIERHQRIRPLPSKREFLLGRALVRTTLSRYAPVEPAGWRFREVERGRPEVSLPAVAPELRFNLSHSHGLAACAVAQELDVGIDVEHPRRTLEIDPFARRFYSPAERETLEPLSGADKRRQFFAIWTLKESYLKARGIGVGLPLSSLSFQIGEDGELAVDLGRESGDRAGNWRFGVWETADGYLVALTIARREAPEPRPVVRRCVPLGPDSEAPRLRPIAAAGWARAYTRSR